jgi:hypothetical protein
MFLDWVYTAPNLATFLEAGDGRTRAIGDARKEDVQILRARVARVPNIVRRRINSVELALVEIVRVAEGVRIVGCTRTVLYRVAGEFGSRLSSRQGHTAESYRSVSGRREGYI